MKWLGRVGPFRALHLKGAFACEASLFWWFDGKPKATERSEGAKRLACQPKADSNLSPAQQKRCVAPHFTTSAKIGRQLAAEPANLGCFRSGLGQKVGSASLLASQSQPLRPPHVQLPLLAAGELLLGDLPKAVGSPKVDYRMLKHVSFD